MILERREAGHHSSVDAKRWDSVRDALLGLGDNIQDCGSKSLKYYTLTRRHSLEVSIYLGFAHCEPLVDEHPTHSPLCIVAEIILVTMSPN
jgi:hypothetical protein